MSGSFWHKMALNRFFLSKKKKMNAQLDGTRPSLIFIHLKLGNMHEKITVQLQITVFLWLKKKKTWSIWLIEMNGKWGNVLFFSLIKQNLPQSRAHTHTNEGMRLYNIPRNTHTHTCTRRFPFKLMVSILSNKNPFEHIYIANLHMD